MIEQIIRRGLELQKNGGNKIRLEYAHDLRNNPEFEEFEYTDLSEVLYWMQTEKRLDDTKVANIG